VVAIAVLLLLIVIGDIVRVEAVPGRPVAQDRDTIKAELLNACDTKFRPTDFTLGAMVDDGKGNRVVAASAKRTIAVCAIQPFSSRSGVMEITEVSLRGRRRVLAMTGNLGDDTNYLGYGRTLPDVARVEIFLPDGRPVPADAAAETFAFLVPLPRDEVHDLTARATDQDGTVLYEGPL
jgi:hypothetical protein